VAVSSPWAGQRLGPVAGQIARGLDYEVVIAHVARATDEDRTESEAKQRGEESMRVVALALNEGGIANQSVMLFSDHVAKAVANLARDRSCQMILAGHAPLRGIRGLFRRDVGSELVRLAEVPVLLCPASWEGGF